MMEKEKRGISFEEVEKIASGMLSQGITPTVRGVMSVTGGRTADVSSHLRDFNNKRNEQVSKMADEIGSSNIAKLIASEIHSIVDKRTIELTDINNQQKDQIDELVSLLKETTKEAETTKQESLEAIEQMKKETTEKIEKITLNAETKIKQAEAEIKKVVEEKNKIETEISEIKLLTKQSIEASKEQASALVDAANLRTQKAEHETELLREQVKSLSVDQATRDIEKAEYEKMKELLDTLRLDYAEQRTDIVKATTENSALVRDLKRLEEDNGDYRVLDKELTKVQTQLIEAQKSITELNSKLSLSERERESLSAALSSTK